MNVFHKMKILFWQNEFDRLLDLGLD